MADKAQSIGEKLDDLGELFKTRLQHDNVQQQAFDHLYKELKQYKEDFLYQAEKPFLLDLLLFYDSLQWFGASLQKGEMDAAVIRRATSTWSTSSSSSSTAGTSSRRSRSRSSTGGSTRRCASSPPRPRKTTGRSTRSSSAASYAVKECSRPEEVSVARYGSNPTDTDPKTETS